jgi:hypothetical protein
MLPQDVETGISRDAAATSNTQPARQSSAGPSGTPFLGQRQPDEADSTDGHNDLKTALNDLVDDIFGG